MKTANSFLTQSYKDGYIHTWVTSTGKNKAQAQIGTSVRELPTVAGCKRWITKMMAERIWIAAQNIQTLEHTK